MALHLPTYTYKGLDVPNNYVKIIEVAYRDYMEEGVKKYSVDLSINIFTDSTKEFPIAFDKKNFDGVAMADLNLVNYYNLLKSTPEYSETTDC